MHSLYIIAQIAEWAPSSTLLEAHLHGQLHIICETRASANPLLWRQVARKAGRPCQW
jgi:hypothetical protein